MGVAMIQSFFGALRSVATPFLVPCVALLAWPGSAQPQVVALGASQTYGKGVERSQAYPAQLQSMLRGQGNSVRAENAGITAETTGGMLGRAARARHTATQVARPAPGRTHMRKPTHAASPPTQ